jgi:hypothetical protein
MRNSLELLHSIHWTQWQEMKVRVREEAFEWIQELEVLTMNTTLPRTLKSSRKKCLPTMTKMMLREIKANF